MNIWRFGREWTKEIWGNRFMGVIRWRFKSNAWRVADWINCWLMSSWKASACIEPMKEIGFHANWKRWGEKRRWTSLRHVARITWEDTFRVIHWYLWNTVIITKMWFYSDKQKSRESWVEQGTSSKILRIGGLLRFHIYWSISRNHQYRQG